MTRASKGAASATRTVKITGALTLGRAAELRTELLAAMDGVSRLSLDLSAVEEVDVAGGQLLCALHRSATTQGKGVEVPPALRSPALLAFAQTTGLSRHQGCEAGCLWQEGAGG